MPPNDGTLLKLRAEDADDLAVISACLQDALVAVRDLAFAPQDHSFLLVANRFCWEHRVVPDSSEVGYQRTLCGVTFQAVESVSYTGFSRSDDERILSLLAIRPQRDGGRHAILLEFSGDATIRIEATRILCHAQDLGERWPTQWQPRHDVDERV